MAGEIPKKIIIPIDIYAGAMRGVRWCGTTILTPGAVGGHAVVSAVGICLRKDDDIQSVDNGLDFLSTKCLATECESSAGYVSLLNPLDEIDEDVAATPLPRMDSPEKIHAGTASAAAIADSERVTLSAFPGWMGQSNKLGDIRIRRCHGSQNRGFHFFHIEI